MTRIMEQVLKQSQKWDARKVSVQKVGSFPARRSVCECLGTVYVEQVSKELSFELLALFVGIASFFQLLNDWRFLKPFFFFELDSVLGNRISKGQLGQPMHFPCWRFMTGTKSVDEQLARNPPKSHFPGSPSQQLVLYSYSCALSGSPLSVVVSLEKGWELSLPDSVNSFR